MLFFLDSTTIWDFDNFGSVVEYLLIIPNITSAPHPTSYYSTNMVITIRAGQGFSQMLLLWCFSLKQKYETRISNKLFHFWRSTFSEKKSQHQVRINPSPFPPPPNGPCGPFASYNSSSSDQRYGVNPIQTFVLKKNKLNFKKFRIALRCLCFCKCSNAVLRSTRLIRLNYSTIMILI
jgi:hypothetical protein